MAEHSGTKKLTQLVAQLEQAGETGNRLQAARCTLRFRRSWIELAAVLNEIYRTGCHRDWGYEDLVSYASGELGLRSATVDKLLVSYNMVQKHAPKRLVDDAQGPIPSYQALDYLARVTSEPRSDGSLPRNAPEHPPDREVVTALRAAVFDEGQSVRQLRQQFDPLVRPLSVEQEQQLVVRRMSASARRLLEQLQEVEHLEQHPLPGLKKLLGELRKQTEALTEQLRALSRSRAA